MIVVNTAFSISYRFLNYVPTNPYYPWARVIHAEPTDYPQSYPLQGDETVRIAKLPWKVRLDIRDDMYRINRRLVDLRRNTDNDEVIDVEISRLQTEHDELLKHYRA